MFNYLYSFLFETKNQPNEIANLEKTPININKIESAQQFIFTNETLKNVKLRPTVINTLKTKSVNDKNGSFNLYMLSDNQLKEILKVKLKHTPFTERPQYYPQRCPVMCELLQKTAHRKSL